MVESDYCPPTDGELLEKYEPVIQELTAKKCRFWKYDLQQELRMWLLLWLRAFDGQLRDLFIRENFTDIIKRFETLERNRGMLDGPEEINWDDMILRWKRHHWNFHQYGHITIFDNHLKKGTGA